MHRTTLLLSAFMLFAIVIARNPRDKYGILYVNEILANSDTFTVQIEDSIVEDNILRLDIIEEWSGDGVRAEGIFFNDGDVVLADDFLVNPNTTFPGELYANGGILADAGSDKSTTRNREDFYSFIVEDDTGLTTFRGTLFVDEGIFLGGTAFTVAAGSGETTVRNARLNPNGGVNVGDGAFTIDQEGSVFVDNDFHVVGTIFIGTDQTQDRFIRRVPTLAQEGGDTVFSAQDGQASGGDLVFVPGYELDENCYDDDEAFGSCQDGSVFVGGIDNRNVRIVRPDVNVDGGQTLYRGQDSRNGDGGDIVFAPGDSTGDGDGGDFIVVPGISAGGNHGHIFFGTNGDVADTGVADFDLTIGRPHLEFGDGGDTFFKGQSTRNGNAGNLNILAGQGSNGAALRLIPGDADQESGALEEQGDIILGNEEPAELVITRSQSNTNGGDTFFEGQASVADNTHGGDFYVKAGDSKGNGNGGSIHLLPGSNPGSLTTPVISAGNIFVGEIVDDLTLTRVPRNGAGLDTFIVGQGGAATQGGDLFFRGGNGGTTGGDLVVRGGDATLDPFDHAFDVGGGVIVASGNGQIDGGNINVYGGPNAGSITIQTNSQTVAGDIYLNAGSGPTMGDIAIGDAGRTFILDETPLTIQDSFLHIVDSSEEVIFRADPMSIFEYNGRTLLRSVSDYPVPAVDTAAIPPASDTDLTETAYRVAELQHSLEVLVNALSQCQHGLFQTVNEFGLPDSCVAFA